MGPKCLYILAVVVALFVPAHAKLPYRPPLRPYTVKTHTSNLDAKQSLIKHCQEHYRETHLDHFSWAPPPEDVTTFQLRYFLCKEHWKHDSRSKGPIFFYVGNEADVTLYLNNSGLMWESAEHFGALLVFAEHRYYGKSKPYKQNLTDHMQFLTSEQAMADYAELISDLKSELQAQSSPVIGFGGSYGGMLGTWFRYKYPHIIDGVIAGSAPIWDFEGEDPPVSEAFFAQIVTRDASPAAGAAEHCVQNIRKAWKVLFDWGRHHDGRKIIRKAMRLCPQAKLDDGEDVDAFALWLQSAFDYLAMGNYPYPSDYILNGIGTLPAFPMRVSCGFMAGSNPSEEQLLQGLADAAGVFYNYSHELPCYNYSQGANEETDEDGRFWDYQFCTEQFMPSSRDGVSDMFWDQPFDIEAATKHCQEEWGVTPRPMWASVQWAGKNLDGLSNVVFSNGDYDPWSGGGVLRSTWNSIETVLVKGGAHHLDLMFSNKDDTESVKHARKVERASIQKWIDQSGQRLRKQPNSFAA